MAKVNGHSLKSVAMNGIAVNGVVLGNGKKLKTGPTTKKANGYKLPPHDQSSGETEGD